MKVQFFFKDQAYNYAITNLYMELLQQDIELITFFGSEPPKKEDILHDTDLVLIHPDLVMDWLLDSKIPVAIVSDVDGGWISPHVHLLPRVQGCIESYAYLPRALHREPHFYYTMARMREAGYVGELKQDHFNPQELSDKDLEKIHVFCGFGSWERMWSLKEWAPDAKTIDWKHVPPVSINFVGTVEYCKTEIEDHRRRAVDICNTNKGLGVPGRKFITWRYWETLKKSRICLSPWGWGEACHRDFEALMLGTVLVKPDWSFVESYPDISSSNAPYIPCKLDFSDVPEIVKNVEDNWEAYENMRRRGRRLAEDALDVRLNAIKLGEIFHKILG